MIIGFDGSRAFIGKRTGTENYSYQLLKALAKIDSKNQYIVYLRSNSFPVIPAKAGIQKKEKSYGSRSEGRSVKPGMTKQDWPDNFKFKILNFKFLWTQGGLAIQTFRDKLDVLFVPSHTLPIIRKPGLKTVITVHDLGSEYLPSMHQLKQRLYLGFMQKYQLKTATKIIAVSKATKEDLIKKLNIPPVIPAQAGIHKAEELHGSRIKSGMTQEDIKVIYEGYDYSLYRKLSIDIIIDRLRQYNLRPQEYFLFVGTVQPRKNLERVIQAFAVHLRGEKMRLHLGGELKLLIVGSKGWLSDEIYALPKKLGIQDKVKFLGYVPDKDLPALYSGAIAFLYPSLFEGFGLPILEAQACGTPVITSNISSMPEVAGKGAIFVDPYSAEDIVRGMEKCQISNVKFQMIKAGFENVKRFSWEKCAKETLKVLEGVI